MKKNNTKDSGDLCKILILCGGKGTRLGALGKNLPKALVRLRGKPILYHKLSNSMDQGFRDFIVAIGYKGSMIVDACAGSGLDCRIEFSDSGVEAGMLRRVYDARRLFNDRVIVSYGDSISNIQMKKLIDFHVQKKSLLTIVTAPIQSPFGLVKTDRRKAVRTLEEKPVLHYYIGTFIMEKKAFAHAGKDVLDQADGKGLISFFTKLRKLGRLYAYSHEGQDITFNTIEELSAAEEGFLKFYTHFQ
jgi:NDP-sugar pyrophosphorylase family protein